MSDHNPQNHIEELLAIMQALRDPATGCPWDQKQTFASIAPYTIEEAYEVADAITRSDMEELRDELGDLLLQVVYHAQMANEQDAFNFTDVVQSICSKMIRRHPHVFAINEYQGKLDLAKEWERIKKQERVAKGQTAEDDSALAHVSAGMPPLLRALKLQKKASRCNFDWPTAEPVLEKIKEELHELEQVIQARESDSRVEEELGDLLFSIINISRHLHVDAELALQKANSKFEQRFRLMEQLAHAQNKSLAEFSEQGLEELWQQAKQQITNNE